jgi:hypothetical protein
MSAPNFGPAPPPTREPSERDLNDNDIARLRFLDGPKRDIIAKLGATPESEQLSHGDNYGYVSRYDVASSIDDPRVGKGIVQSILVLWTTDCKAFRIATYPTFELTKRVP